MLNILAANTHINIYRTLRHVLKTLITHSFIISSMEKMMLNLAANAHINIYI